MYTQLWIQGHLFHAIQADYRWVNVHLETRRSRQLTEFIANQSILVVIRVELALALTLVSR